MSSPVALQRDHILNDKSLRSVQLCNAHSAAIDTWLQTLFRTVTEHHEGLALVAVGGYGRSELSPGSDIDVMLVHAKGFDVEPVAEKLWYPVWDEGLKLGHSVRTVAEALDLAADDLATGTSLLDTRLIAGDVVLAADLASGARKQWRSNANRNLTQLAESVRDRHEQMGEVAFLLEPDIKEGRGGMRDVHALRWAEAAEALLSESDSYEIDKAYETLVRVRAELHRVSGRPNNVLLLEQQDDVAAAAGYSDADAMMAELAASARLIAWTSDATWHRVRRSLRGRRLRSPKPREVATGVVLEDRVVRLDRRTDVADEPLTVLRLAVEAATHQAFIERDTLDRLTQMPDLPVPWPDEARQLLADLLLTGTPAIDVIEALDQVGLFARLIPEWEPCRSRPQRNAYHTFTVDRHLCETAAQASKHADRVDRPDLLVLGALLHDIGKGYPGDHTEVGIELVETIASRMGFERDETDVLVDMVRHHLLLPDAATRRDLDDDGTILAVAQQVGSLDTLELLAALTEADSIATGPAAWGTWKAELLHTLVERVGHVLLGGAVDDLIDTSFPSSDHLALMRAGDLVFDGRGDTLVVIAPDSVGLFSRVAGVLALNGGDVLEASAASDFGMGLEVFRVAASNGAEPPWDRIIDDLHRSVNGRLAIDARLAERQKLYESRRTATARPMTPTVVFDNNGSANATVLEVSCPDRIGVLYRITKALHEFDLDIVSAKVQTLMHDVVDTFYVREAGGGSKLVDPEFLAEIEKGLLHALRT